MAQYGSIIRVFVCSPSDMTGERQLAPKVIDDWNRQHSLRHEAVLQCVKWETHASPSLDEPAQERINRTLVDSSDILIGFFWSTLGGRGAVKEVDRFKKAGKPVLLYFSNRPIPRERAGKGVDQVNAFKKRMQPCGLYREYKSVRRLASQLEQDLNDCIVELLAREKQSAAAANYPRKPRSEIRLCLYSKSESQFVQNVADVHKLSAEIGVSLSNFRKPDLYKVFQELRKTGQPDTTVIDLDEFWVKDLAKMGRLLDLSNFDLNATFHRSLMLAGSWGGKQWAVPRFLDFSLYLCLQRDLTTLRNWLYELRETQRIKSVRDHVQNLMKRAKTNSLLAYDFHTPDTCVCVTLEFIEGFGDGYRSLSKPMAAASEANVFAMQILKAMVGEGNGAPTHSFPEPINFDEQFNSTPFVHNWHSRMSDTPANAADRTALFDAPMPGTLGGWYVGVLAPNSLFPDLPRRLHQLGDLLFRRDTQEERLRRKAGLPTLDDFYTQKNINSFPDPVTKWPLSRIPVYVDRLVRRSHLTNFLSLRERLIELHNEVIQNRSSMTADIAQRLLSTLHRRAKKIVNSQNT
jgi:hypothetical protein